MTQAGGLFLTTEACGESEDAAFAGLAFDVDVTGHHVHKAHGDGEAEAGAAEFARRGGIGLGERAKEAGLLFGRHADACVADGELEFDFVVIDSAPAARKRRLRPAR